MRDLALVLQSLDASTPPPAVAVRAPLAAEALAAATPQLRRLVHRVLGWPARATDVDDVVQETLLAAWRHRGAFRGDAAWTTWLSRIALRQASRHARSAALRRRLFGWLGAGDGEPAAAAEPAPDERIDATRRALQRLAHPDREVLVLRYLEQRDVPQIGALLGCRRAAVDARLSRARARLRAALDLPEDAP